MALVPTLLVGLGGIGSRIVDEIYGMIPPEDRGRIAIHAFDTNVNDIAKLKHIGGMVTQTSAPWTVRQYLHKYPDFRRWFPDDQPEILGKLLADGAGQVRAVSRLGFLAAIHEHGMDKLQRQLNGLFTLCEDEHLGGMRIMIACSLAGGTGAGIFQQTALMLKDMVRRRNAAVNVNVRGAFLLPDVMCRSGAISPDQFNNIRANGYACFKELDALNSNFLGRPVGIDQPLELEHSVFDHTAMTLPEECRPYEFGFLYDFENSRGQNLGIFDHYVRQMIKSIQLQLFSPMANNQFSEEDNRIIGFVEGRSRNRYGGTGVASLLYPCADLVDYLSLRWGTSVLGEEWLKLDTVYEQEVRTWEQEKKAGISRSRPELPKRYVALLEDWAGTEGSDPLYKELLASTRMPVQEGVAGDGESKVDHFITEVENKVQSLARENAEMTAFEAACTLDQGALKKRDRARHQILQHEGNLTVYRDRVKGFVRDNSTSIVYQIILEDASEPLGCGGQPLRLNSWLVGGREPLHPVAQRYFLYRLKLELDARQKSLSTDLQQLEESLAAYEKAYDLTETRGIYETADMRVDLALKQNRLLAVINDDFKNFVAEYQDKAGKQKRNIARYKEEKLKELVFADLSKKVGLLLERFEAYFRGLDETQRVLLRDAEAQADAHERATDPTLLHVLATRADKEQLWKDHNLHLTGLRLPGGIAKEIYLGLYRELCEGLQKAQKGLPIVRVGTEAAFRRDVLGWCNMKIREDRLVEFNLVEALEREALMAGKNPEEHIRQRIASLDTLAHPWIPAQSKNEIAQWGTHPVCLKPELLLPKIQNELFGGFAGEQGSRMVADTAFSPYELIRYRCFFGLTADDFPQFSAEIPGIRAEGSYFSAYQKRIQLLSTSGKTVTPHLDKRWHQSAYLPDLNPERREQEMERLNRAFVLGLNYGFFRAEENYGRNLWNFYDPAGKTAAVMIAGQPVEGDPHLLHKALAYNAALIDKVLLGAEQAFVDDVRRHKQKVGDYRFVGGGQTFNLVDQLWNFPAGDLANNALVDLLTDKLLPLWLDFTFSAYARAMGASRQTLAISEGRKHIEVLMQQSTELQSVGAKDPLLNRWNHAVNSFIDKIA